MRTITLWLTRAALKVPVLLLALGACTQENKVVYCNEIDFLEFMQTGSPQCDICVTDYATHEVVGDCWGYLDTDTDTGTGTGTTTVPDTDTDTTAPDDYDGDGVSSAYDCDDSNAAVTYGDIWYIDYDGDGYGADAYTQVACDMPSGYVANADDCDDTDANINPAANEICDVGDVDEDCNGSADDEDAADATYWFVDADGDGYGTIEEILEQCDMPTGYVANADDCDDADNDIHPGADESDCADATDYNCDGSTGYEDADLDGVAACEDCDDGDEAQHPGADEYCNAEDDDCDGSVDENDAVDVGTWYYDDDGDGYGVTSTTLAACDAPAGYAAVDGDCDNSSTLYHPGATEDCEDPVDYNCDGSVGYADADGDGSAACVDCDDTEASAHPGGTEACDAIDNDCDGTTDEADATDAATWYLDADSDAYGKSGSSTVSCDMPSGYADNDDDCDDSRSATNPGADEACNGIDDDCDGRTDTTDAIDADTWHRDSDGDGYGNASSSSIACDAPSGYVADDTDCDDSNASANPGEVEVCDASDIDEDCDGLSDDEDSSATGMTAWYYDDDLDTYGDPETSMSQCEDPGPDWVENADDCDDQDNDVPATEACE